MPLAELALLILIAAAAWSRTASIRPVGWSAAVLAALAIAGIRASPTPRPATLLGITLALVLLAAVLGIVAAWGERRQSCLWWPGTILGLVGSLGLALAMVPGLAGADPRAFLAALGVASAATLLLHVIGRRVSFPQHYEPLPPLRPEVMTGTVALGLLDAALAPHLGLVIVGVVVAVWGAWGLHRREGGSRLPIAPALAVLLFPLWWLMATIAGPEGLALRMLPEVPLSPAAERLLAPVALVAAWATAGLWPLHRQVGALAAPAGALLLIRVIWPAMPQGMEHWRALAMPLVLLGLWHAALSVRLSGLAIGMAWVGLLGGTRGGDTGAALLLGAAVGLELRRRYPALAAQRAATLAIALVGGSGALLALESGLGAEVVYTLLGAAGLVAAAAACGAAMMARDRSTTEPSR
jgi:hypothetical protein